ncbi:HEPN domain-containing protein [Polaribacter sp. HaHaR_3_91]|uniref:HEPN domain-containing protein n=1 Tax=Polaribacter sp. HaHaR_3_91 TaxID=2745561 RepID=UPI001C4FDB13|nr:HEPN domain-containing protein [Polaribacter sp. HaHaR_3_91]QXP62757.1 hypothetical protein H0I27_12900 [Polaribacter sp. HaHaR_3_91]
MTNKKEKRILSAPYARLIGTISSLNLQLLISTQFSEQDCLNWEQSLRDDLGNLKSKLKVDSILKRLSNSPVFMLDELRMSSIDSTIITYTSSIELFIREIIDLSLRRNSSLRKKAFSKVQISALELENKTELNEIKNDLFKTLSIEHSKGQLLSEKLKRASKFLSISKSSTKDILINDIDSIWKLRNSIAHSNDGNKTIYEFTSNNIKKTIGGYSTKEEYLNFTTELLEPMNAFFDFLEEWQNEVLDKWDANSFIHYKKTTPNTV